MLLINLIIGLILGALLGESVAFLGMYVSMSDYSSEDDDNAPYSS